MYSSRRSALSRMVAVVRLSSNSLCSASLIVMNRIDLFWHIAVAQCWCWQACASRSKATHTVLYQ
ncbi:hypothetical protein ALP29_201749 [Pseudomonas syringae pv. avii]|uniref:Secreted protein n=1 Tax=Pseudomonas syringae pv. avii TaxID=663959 RepID=A0A3M5VH11_PSESX|nr:hypothetical protein ALP29_201749 [Pseudomonas syringae pv. avii]